MDPLTRLLLDAQRGDQGALDRFVRMTWYDVEVVCRYLGDRDTVDDLVQETYQRMFVSLHRFRATGPARHWLLTIARRTCADHARHRSRRRRLDQRVGSLARDDLEVGAPHTNGSDVLDLLEVLDHDRRAAFVLTQLNGLRYDEAAALLDVPIGTIRSRVSRAREQLIGAVHAADAADAVGATSPEPHRRRTGPT